MFIHEKNLSEQFRSTVGEIKSLVGETVTPGMICETDPEEMVVQIRAIKAINDMLELCCDMFEKQERLMDKMDKAMDKYLEGQE